MATDSEQAGNASRRRIKSPQDFGAGLFLLALGALGFFAGFELEAGTLDAVGPGLVPKVVAAVVGAFGVFLILQSLLVHGELLERWHLRQPFFVLGAIVIFALTIRHFGLIIAGPLTMIFASYAEPSLRLRTVVIYSVLMTLVCVILFKLLLALPIPALPDGIYIKGLS